MDMFEPLSLVLHLSRKVGTSEDDKLLTRYDIVKGITSAVNFACVKGCVRLYTQKRFMKLN